LFSQPSSVCANLIKANINFILIDSQNLFAFGGGFLFFSYLEPPAIQQLPIYKQIFCGGFLQKTRCAKWARIYFLHNANKESSILEFFF